MVGLEFVFLYESRVEFYDKIQINNTPDKSGVLLIYLFSTLDSYVL